MEIRCEEITTPWGVFCACFSRRGLRRLLFPGSPCPGSSWDRHPLAVDLEEELGAYFRGEIRAFTIPLDPVGTRFRLRVWEELSSVPYGETVTYGELARRVGSPRAARAVGMAVAANPIPILIPCHRVLPKGGGIGNFGPGIHWKERLLRLEGVLR